MESGEGAFLSENRVGLEDVRASSEELAKHEAILDLLDNASDTGSAWRNRVGESSKPNGKPNNVAD